MTIVRILGDIADQAERGANAAERFPEGIRRAGEEFDRIIASAQVSGGPGGGSGGGGGFARVGGGGSARQASGGPGGGAGGGGSFQQAAPRSTDIVRLFSRTTSAGDRLVVGGLHQVVSAVRQLTLSLQGDGGLGFRARGGL